MLHIDAQLYVPWYFLVVFYLDKNQRKILGYNDDTQQEQLIIGYLLLIPVLPFTSTNGFLLLWEQ